MMPPNPDDLHGATAATLQAEGRALQALARSLVGADDAEDVVQDAAVAALRRPPQRLGSWLSATVRNLAHMRRRSAMRRRAHERRAAVSAVDEANEPAAIAAQAELARAVSAAVAGLAEPFRTAVVMRFWRGMKPEAIAAELGVPRNTVRSRLQRGLEAVRVRLDQKYGTRERWSAPMLLLARVREGSAVAGGGVALWLVGGLMQGKVLVGAAAIVVAAAAVSLWSPSAASAPATTTSAAASPAAANASVTDAPARTVVPVPTANAPTANNELAATSPWLATFLVVDEDDLPVADAEINVFAGPNAANDIFGGKTPDPTVVLRTDRAGCSTTTIAAATAVAIARAERIRSGAMRLDRASSNAPIKIVLEAPVAVHGRVLRIDGSAGAGARVTARVAGLSTAMRSFPLAPPDTVADEQGRFTVALQRHAGFSLTAELDGHRTFTESVLMHQAEVPDVTLVFPGAITMSGLVVAADGKPVTKAYVTAWRELRAGAGDEGERLSAETDAAGHFALQLRHCARYQVIADAENHAASDLVGVEVTEAQPHVEVRLALQRFTSIAGVVLHADRSPFRGVRVTASPETGDGKGGTNVPMQSDRFADVPPVTTGDDGAFALTVHPGTTWTVRAFPVAESWLIAATQKAVKPGATSLEFVVAPEQLVEGVVRGAVVGADGTPLERYELALYRQTDAGEFVSSWMGPVLRTGNRFELRGLPIGTTWVLSAQAMKPVVADARPEPCDLPPARSEPFVASAAGAEFTLRVPAWAELPVRVLDAKGEPARRVLVAMHSRFAGGSYQTGRHVDRDGCVVLAKGAAGTHDLYVCSENLDLLLQREVTIAQGPNPELIIRLPAKSGR